MKSVISEENMIL